ncbi:hypothetical protein ACEN8I_03380 [Polaromonas sp. CT11-55]|uniref:hypothetical protein n=1 Tax=Polaromonas sp. CT11-55 TaxID=3243045 RepID=UPI0039A59021
MKSFFYLAIAALSILAGCASIEPPLASTALPEKGFGYISSLAYTSTTQDFSLTLENTATGKKYGLPLGDSSSPAANLSDKITAIKVPTGKYKLVNWSDDGIFLNGLKNSASGAHPLMQAFTVSDGSVTVLGRFILDRDVKAGFPYTWITNSIRPGPISEKEVKELFHAAYPLLTEKSLSCLACTDY